MRLHAGVVLCMQCVLVMCRTEYYLCKNPVWLNVDVNNCIQTSLAKIDNISAARFGFSLKSLTSALA